MINHHLQGIGTSLSKSLTGSFHDSPQVTETLLQSYGIVPEDTDNNVDNVNNVLHFANDIGFYAPVVAFAEGWPVGRAHMFHFNEPNPWDGQFKGVASHILDVAFLFQNYNDYLDEEQRRAAETFAAHVLDFVVGKEPYPTYTPGKGGAMVYGPGGPERQRFVQSTKSEDYGRRSTIFELEKLASLDALSLAWDKFMAGG